MPTAAWYGWHVLRPHRHLHHDPYTRVEVGVPLSMDAGPRGLALHWGGMHATQDILYAVEHTTGLWVCRVQLLGKRLDEETQSCAQTRVVLWMVDAEPVLYQWMGRCLERALDDAILHGHPGEPLVGEVMTLVRAQAEMPVADPMLCYQEEMREEMHCPLRLIPVLDAMLVGGVRTGSKLSNFPRWFFNGPSWRRQLFPTWHPFLWCVRGLPAERHDETYMRILPMERQFMHLLRTCGSDAAWQVLRAAYRALQCLFIRYHNGRLDCGAQPALVARHCALAGGHAEEAEWQRRLLETMLFRAAGKPVEHWQPPAAPLEWPVTVIPRDLRYRASKAYRAGVRFDLLPPAGRCQMQRLWRRRGYLR